MNNSDGESFLSSGIRCGGRKNIGEKKRGNATAGISNQMRGKQSENPFYKPLDSDAVDVARLQQKYITRHTSGSTTNGCQI